MKKCLGALALWVLAGCGGSTSVTDVSGLAPVAKSGSYKDLTDTPSLSKVATSGSYADLQNVPTFSAVATSGHYGDLIGAPALSTVASTGAYADLTGTPQLSAVATSGRYADLAGAPALSPVALSGSYADLSGRPTLAPVATSGAFADLTGAPTFSTVATSGSYADLTGQPWTVSPEGISTLQTVSVGGPASTAPLTVSVDGSPFIDQASVVANVPLGIQFSSWQSFTPGVTGKLLEVQLQPIYSSPTTGYTLNVYSGEGTSGQLLYTQSGVSLALNTLSPVTFTTPVHLSAGTLYTWQLTNGSAFTLLGSYGNGTDNYPGGRADLPVSPNVFFDYIFQTKMSVPSPAVQVDSSGNLGVGTTSATDTLDVNGSMRLRASRSPASTDPCQPGEIAWDSGSVYVCVAQDTWRRSALVAY